MSRIMKHCGMDYIAIDIFEYEATMLFDLNSDEVPENMFEQFDLVTNFGTTEHVLDQYKAFQTMHNFTKPGGCIYHDLPMGGYFYHGYFSYTPLLFNHLAEANKYEILFRHFSKVAHNTPFTSITPDEMIAGLWPDSGYHDVGIEYIFRKTSANAFALPVEVATSHAVDSAFLRSKRSDIAILGQPTEGE